MKKTKKIIINPQKSHIYFDERTKLLKIKDNKYYMFRCALERFLPRIKKQLPQTFTDKFFLEKVAMNLPNSYSSICNLLGQASVDKWIKVWYLRIRSDSFTQIKSCNNKHNWQKKSTSE